MTQGCLGASRLLALPLFFFLASPALPQANAIIGADGTVIQIGEDSAPETGERIEILPDGTIIGIGQPGAAPEEPGFEDLGGREAAREDSWEASCDPKNFKKNGSRFFWLHHCPSAAGWAAFRRVQDPIDDAWIRVSTRFGSLYDTKVEGYIYTSGSHYHGQTGGPAWSGGFFSPQSNQMHVPAPPGKTGFALESLLTHELTHFRLDQLTWNEQANRGMIGSYRFLNEGLAQVMEQKLYEEKAASDPRVAADPGLNVKRRKLFYLMRGFEQGHPLIPLKVIQRQIAGDVGFFYAESWAVAAYIEEEWGERMTDYLLAEVKKTTDLDAALRASVGVDAETLLERVAVWIQEQVRAEFGE